MADGRRGHLGCGHPRACRSRPSATTACWHAACGNLPAWGSRASVLLTRGFGDSSGRDLHGKGCGRVDRGWDATQLLASGVGKLAIRTRAGCGRLRANTGSWRRGLDASLGIPATAFFAAWWHGARESPLHAARDPCMRPVVFFSRQDALSTGLFNLRSAQHGARTGHPGTADAGIRGAHPWRAMRPGRQHVAGEHDQASGRDG